MAVLKLEVVSAEKSIYSGSAKMVVLPGESGELGILPGHTPLITRIRPGTLKIVQENDEAESIFVAGGILEVQPNVVTVLADVAVRMAELDEAKAEEARRKAEESLREAKSQGQTATSIAIMEAEFAMLQAQVAEIHRFKKHSHRA